MGKVRRVARPGSQPGGAAGKGAAESPWGETGTIPNPEVVAKATRRRFGAEYKLGIVRETERLTEPGAIGEVLRREGLYSTHLSAWRRERDRGALDAMGARRRGRKADPAQPLRQRISELEREGSAVERLRQAEPSSASKKLSEILAQGAPIAGAPDGSFVDLAQDWASGEHRPLGWRRPACPSARAAEAIEALRPRPIRPTLGSDERQTVLACHSARRDRRPRRVAELWTRSGRIFALGGQVGSGGGPGGAAANQLRHPAYARPTLATGPNRVVVDITKLRCL